ncbi:unnamed protein product [Hymenolepis diminuta]|uniref:C2H2-type domain-containing protein n=2 Tax=Hymenolepis diminuta TaxID=6216 RepID=A0A158QFV2_HYMDI|nr:unnamed protein product [Hymenolepis diminuta]
MSNHQPYQIGDYVFVEESPAIPYQIRKIAELDRYNSNDVEMKVKCFYRRRELPPDVAEQHSHVFSVEGLSEKEIYDLSLRELFVSQTFEIVHANRIRGKCNVIMMEDVVDENLVDLIRENATFFYHLSYDPVKRSIKSDKGYIRVGSEFQATIPNLIDPTQTHNDNNHTSHHERETLVWSPPINLSPSDLDSYMTMCKSLATLARANYPPSTLRHPTLVSCVACASRDTTLQMALDTLQQAGHSIRRALQILAPPNQPPLLKLDQMEMWSITEGNLFQQGLHKFGKSFQDVQTDLLPWKTLKCIIEFYYMWKTTDHYIQQRRAKCVETEKRLKHMYVKVDRKVDPSVLYQENFANCAGCGSVCTAHSYGIGSPPNLLKVCGNCWVTWKEYGDLKDVSVYDKLGPMTLVYNCPLQSCSEQFEDRLNLIYHLDAKHPQYGSACANQVQPTFTFSGQTSSSLKPHSSTASRNSTFYFLASPNLRFARRMEVGGGCRQRARRPFKPITLEMAVLKALLVSRLNINPELLGQLADSVYKKTAQFPSKEVAVKRLSNCIKKLQPQDCRKRKSSSGRETVTPSSDDPSQPSPSSNSSSAAIETQSPSTSSNRTETLMFHATKNIKQKRKEALPSASLHRLCRRPWSTDPLPDDLKTQMPNECSSSSGADNQ